MGPDTDLLEQLRAEGPIPRHVAIIMDGNGRWATSRGLPRQRGHSAGMEAVREAIRGAAELGIGVLTLFAFSQENWSRPAGEVGALMRLLRLFASREREELRARGVEVRIFGERERLPATVRRAVDEIERVTAGGATLRVNLMISYGGRQELARAARRLAERVRAGSLDPSDIDEAALAGELYTAGQPDPDLLIRTSGEQRISNFMLWQLAYTEIYITPVLWPDFTQDVLFGAIRDFQQRERRFGRVSAI